MTLRAATEPATLLIACAFVATGCSFGIADFSAISTRNLNIQAETGAQPVEGTDCVYLALGIIPTGKGIAPSLHAAVDDALTHAPGANALQNAELYSEVFTTLLMTRHCFRVVGEAVHIAEAQQPPAALERQSR
ncbi:MAG: hypothetical protein ACREQF_09850 [Candidatus Binataceae bacterium]